MKLQQDQIWKVDGKYLRIVRLERLKVEYKSMLDPVKSKDGTHHHVSKKEFCRLLKNATLWQPAAATEPST
jgi:hypothetical protein